MLNKRSQIKRFIPQGGMPYAPQEWRNLLANCYSYASGLKDGGVATPGALCRRFLLKGSDVNAQSLAHGVRIDGFRDMRLHEKSPKTHHIMMMFYNAARRDAHFYHMHKDGSWSNLQRGAAAVLGGGVAENFITRRHFDGYGLPIRSPSFDAKRLGYDEMVGVFYMEEDGIDYISHS